ncbi:hypothetical protein HAX54_006036 [Datura stramonium]|uniref:Uncharacterized protein n=1 Tax=Datura stramonium TaxID=4076 RepID=A0ABS8RV26_DATST|nr:hypothetical protein [Datura stramonium]
MILFDVQVQNPHNIKYNSTIQGLRYIWRTEGFKGLFKGNDTNSARIVPNSAVKFFSYEQASKGILYLYWKWYVCLPSKLYTVHGDYLLEEKIGNIYGDIAVFVFVSPSFCP